MSRRRPSKRALAAPARLLALMTALMLMLGACSPMLPTDGPVGTSAPDADRGFNYAPQAAPPPPDADPDEIVEGFIRAGAGPQDDYAVARQFMTAEAAREWRPDERTVVYTEDDFPTQFSGENTRNVQLSVESIIDSSGIRTRLPERSTESLDFTLEQVGSQWRITDAPDGTMLLAGTVDQVFRPHTLYYFDPQLRYAVPDQRWFLNRPGLSSAIVAALLEGPAPYLEPAVVSAFPDGAELERASVPVDEGIAAVDFAAEGITAAEPAERALMQEQLDLALGSLSSVEEVELTVEQRELEIPVEADLPEEDRLDINASPEVGSTQVGILNGELRRQNDQVLLSVANLADISDLDPQDPAVPNDVANVFAFLDGDAEELYHLRPNREPDLVLEEENLTRPSMDNFGWTWVASESGGEAVVHAVAYDESLEPSRAEVSADWLASRSITSLRISQDGARAAMILDDDGERGLYVAGVIRDAAGAPQGLGQPMRVQTSVELEEVRWRGPDALYVWASSEEEPMTPEWVTLTGANRVDPALLGLLNVSVGEGQDIIFAETVDVPFQNLASDAWVANEDIEIRDLAYPG